MFLFLCVCWWEKNNCVGLCAYIKSDNYWEDAEAPCCCSHMPKPLTGLISLPHPYLSKHFKKIIIKLIFLVCFQEIFKQLRFKKNTTLTSQLSKAFMQVS